MNSVRKIARNTTFLFLSQIFSYLFGFLYVMYSARYLGADGFGILSFAIAFTGIFGFLADLGLSSLSVREVSRDKSLANKYLGNIVIIKSLLSIATFVLIIVLINLLGYPQLTIIVVYLLAISTILACFSDIFNSIFQAHQKMEYISFGQIINNLMLLIGALLAIYLNGNVISFAFAYLIANMAYFIYSVVTCVTLFVWPKIEIDLQFWKLILIEAIPISLSIIFSVVAFRIDTVILSLIKGNLAVGFYSASYKLIEALMIIPIVFTSAMYPVFSSLFKSSDTYLELSYKKSIRYLTIIGIPIAFGTAALSNKIILLIYQSGYSQSIIILQILVWAIPFIFISYISRTLLISINQQKLLLKIVFICMITNIILNFILIPQFSYLGASIVTVVTEFLSFILCFHYLTKFICKIKIQSLVIKPIIGSIIMALFILYTDLNLFLQIFISIIIYFTILTILKTFSKEDLNLIKHILNG